jgi:hypothetical protein
MTMYGRGKDTVYLLLANKARRGPSTSENPLTTDLRNMRVSYE